MNDYVLGLKIHDLEKRVEEMGSTLLKIERRLNSENSLWDNSEMIRKWKVSERTLATWRQEKLIGYVKVGGKIYYTPADREKFLNFNHVRGS